MNDMNRLFQDFVYGLRMLRKSPGFTALAVITLALGIGANTAIFSNVNALVLRPFAIPHLDRVVAIWETTPQQNTTSVRAAPANFRDWTEQSASFEHLAAIHGWDANLTGNGIAERVEGYQVTPDFFALLGVAPEYGRQIGAIDFQHGVSTVVVISHAFWRNHLGGDASVVGKSLLLNGQKFTVIGVAGPAVDFPAGAEIWTPFDLNFAAGEDRANHYLLALGRLKQEASVVHAGADLQAVANRLAQQFPKTNGGHSVRVVPLAEDATNGTRQFVTVLMGAAIFVLLLACVNVANLQLARVSSRQKEMAVRLGLGASRWHLVRQLLVESTLLALAGASGGVVVSSWGMGLLRRGLPPFIVAHVPGLAHLEVDSNVLWFTLAVAVLSGILAGLAPALRFSRSELSDALKENTRSASASRTAGRLRTVLVVSEVALALVLLVGAGLMVKGFRHLLATEMGFDRTHVLTFHVTLPEEKYPGKDQAMGYYGRVIRELRALPGVESVGCVTTLPSAWNSTWAEYRAEGRPPASPGEMPYTLLQIASPDFFSALSVPLLRGRFLSAEDGPDASPVAVISETMAHNNWPGQDPIGKHVRLGPPERTEPERRIVGVVGDIKSAFSPNPGPATYLPFEQSPEPSSALVVRTSGDPLALAVAVIAHVQSISPDVPAYDVRSLEQIISDNLSGVESSAHMMLVFGFIALALAAAGIFGVQAYSVAQRTHEIGVRMALGAGRGDVVKLVVTSAIKMAIAGLAIGICVALLLTRALSSVLFGVIRIDAAVFVLLTLVLAAVSAVAAYIPAHWATRVDPLVALRCE
jgi:putative ABC transport system permease protein